MLVSEDFDRIVEYSDIRCRITEGNTGYSDTIYSDLLYASAEAIFAGANRALRHHFFWCQMCHSVAGGQKNASQPRVAGITIPRPESVLYRCEIIKMWRSAAKAGQAISAR